MDLFKSYDTHKAYKRLPSLLVMVGLSTISCKTHPHCLHITLLHIISSNIIFFKSGDCHYMSFSILHCFTIIFLISNVYLCLAFSFMPDICLSHCSSESSLSMSQFNCFSVIIICCLIVSLFYCFIVSQSQYPICPLFHCFGIFNLIQDGFGGISAPKMIFHNLTIGYAILKTGYIAPPPHDPYHSK